MERLNHLGVVRQLQRIGTLAWMVCGDRTSVAMQSEHGLRLAVAFTPPEHERWAAQVTLLLAQYDLDAALVYWQDRWWIARRYGLALPLQQLEQGVILQLGLAHFLEAQLTRSVQG